MVRKRRPTASKPPRKPKAPRARTRPEAAPEFADYIRIHGNLPAEEAEAVRADLEALGRELEIEYIRTELSTDPMNKRGKPRPLNTVREGLRPSPHLDRNQVRVIVVEVVRLGYLLLKTRTGRAVPAQHELAVLRALDNVFATYRAARQRGRVKAGASPPPD